MRLSKLLQDKLIVACIFAFLLLVIITVIKFWPASEFYKVSPNLSITEKRLADSSIMQIKAQSGLEDAKSMHALCLLYMAQKCSVAFETLSEKSEPLDNEALKSSVQFEYRCISKTDKNFLFESKDLIADICSEKTAPSPVVLQECHRISKK